MSKCYLFAGEASGDLHGSRLMQALRKRSCFTHFRGVGGPLMRAQHLEIFLKMENFQVMGFSDVLRALPKLWKLFYQVRDDILRTNPACVVLIDYPGFNLRLARALRKKGFKGKIVQYICPTVWAHGKHRIKTMVQTLDLLLTIYPFEAAYFAHTPLKVQYIGNPLVENLARHSYQDNWMQRVGIPSSSDLIAIFPGSRKGEIIRHTAQQLQTAALLKRRHPQLLFALSCAHEELKPALEQAISQSSLQLNQDIYLTPSQFNYELMRDSRTALAKSGTVSLELALHCKPSLILYTLTSFNYFVAKYVLRLNLPHYCIVNILRQKEVFPELIGRQLDTQALLNKLAALHFDENLRQKLKEECMALHNQLGSCQPNEAASKAIEELLIC
ncbi:lipid-A-disaccharide synthase [Candidatus Protochlamydia phocaeensis]|uniref:lipid-A-disaccharide synthase n=1 Tax=Candidatus Protochlamydia phocaeensis TaxID=1414722 RepID=UPI000838EA2D|nr:lipid-A-disaccharide synthase [Candidatus Protochlamydia phocaeensis]